VTEERDRKVLIPATTTTMPYTNETNTKTAKNKYCKEKEIITITLQVQWNQIKKAHNKQANQRNQKSKSKTKNKIKIKFSNLYSNSTSNSTLNSNSITCATWRSEGCTVARMTKQTRAITKGNKIKTNKIILVVSELRREMGVV
jgi:hypothetical protein